MVMRGSVSADRVDDSDLDAQLLRAWRDRHACPGRGRCEAEVPRTRVERALIRDADYRPERLTERAGELGGLGLGVVHGRGAGPSKQSAGVGQVQRDTVDGDGVAARGDCRLDLAACLAEVREGGGELLA